MAKLSRWARVARRRRLRIGNEFGHLMALRKRRLVRITVVTKTDAMVGAPCGATYAFVDLDDGQVDRLIRRLQAIRGGKRALP